MKLFVWRDKRAVDGWHLATEEGYAPTNPDEMLIIDTDALGPHASDTERAAAEADNSLLLESARRRVRNLPPIIRRVGKTEKED